MRLYNQYIPQNSVYSRIGSDVSQPTPEGSSSFDFSLFSSVGRHEKNAGGMLSGILKYFGFSNIDFGDILLVLIFILVLSEGESFELAMILGLVLLLSFIEADEVL